MPRARWVPRAQGQGMQTLSSSLRTVLGITCEKRGGKYPDTELLLKPFSSCPSLWQCLLTGAAPLPQACLFPFQKKVAIPSPHPASKQIFLSLILDLANVFAFLLLAAERR